MLIFVYLIFTAMMLVFVGILIMKKENETPIKSFINSIYNQDKDGSIEFRSNVLQKEPTASSREKKEQEEFEKMVKAIDVSSKILDSYRVQKSTSQELAESIASIAISLTLLIFVGFVMKASIMFIKYHMQIGNDYDNQKIAYLLSKGNIETFEKTLNGLRTHNITFDKTPNLPQEKIINGLIAALSINKKKE